MFPHIKFNYLYWGFDSSVAELNGLQLSLSTILCFMPVGVCRFEVVHNFSRAGNVVYIVLVVVEETVTYTNKQCVNKIYCLKLQYKLLLIQKKKKKKESERS